MHRCDSYPLKRPARILIGPGRSIRYGHHCSGWGLFEAVMAGQASIPQPIPMPSELGVSVAAAPRDKTHLNPDLRDYYDGKMRHAQARRREMGVGY